MCLVIDDIIYAISAAIVVAADAAPVVGAVGAGLEVLSLAACAAHLGPLASFLGSVGSVFGAVSGVGGALGAIDVGVTALATGTAAGAEGAAAGVATTFDDIYHGYQVVSGMGQLAATVTGNSKAAAYFGGINGLVSTGLALGAGQVTGAVQGVLAAKTAVTSEAQIVLEGGSKADQHDAELLGLGSGILDSAYSLPQSVERLSHLDLSGFEGGPPDAIAQAHDPRVVSDDTMIQMSRMADAFNAQDVAQENAANAGPPAQGMYAPPSSAASGDESIYEPDQQLGSTDVSGDPSTTAPPDRSIRYWAWNGAYVVMNEEGGWTAYDPRSMTVVDQGESPDTAPAEVDTTLPPADRFATLHRMSDVTAAAPAPAAAPPPKSGEPVGDPSGTVSVGPPNPPPAGTTAFTVRPGLTVNLTSDFVPPPGANERSVTQGGQTIWIDLGMTQGGYYYWYPVSQQPPPTPVDTPAETPAPTQPAYSQASRYALNATLGTLYGQLPDPSGSSIYDDEPDLSLWSNPEEKPVPPAAPGPSASGDQHGAGEAPRGIDIPHDAANPGWTTTDEIVSGVYEGATSLAGGVLSSAKYIPGTPWGLAFTAYDIYKAAQKGGATGALEKANEILNPFAGVISLGYNTVKDIAAGDARGIARDATVGLGVLAMHQGLKAAGRLAAGKGVPAPSAAGELGAGKGTGGGTVRVYRVEGAPNTRIIFGENGQVTIVGDQTLFLNFGSEARAAEFLKMKVSQGLPGAEAKSFEVPASFVEELRATAVPEKFVKGNRGLPVVVDVSKAPDQYGLRPRQIDALRDVIVPGSGKRGL